MLRTARTTLGAALAGGLMLTMLGSGAQAAPAAEQAPDGGHPNPVPEPVLEAAGEGDVVTLTVDDGPNPGETDALLDFLAEHDITAVFCVIGQNITAPGGEELLRRIVEDGHVLCNHATSYADMGDWEPEGIRADLIETLEVIRDAAGDPDLEVPFFRAPNGSWGQTPEVAVELGMQPLAVANVIFDWETQDEEVLTENLRAAMIPGELVLVHDGGGDRWGTIAAVETVVAEKLAEGWEFTLPVGLEADGSDDGDGHDGAASGQAPQRVSAGEEVSISLDGLEPGAEVELHLRPAGAHGSAQMLGTLEVDAEGAAAGDLQVPAETARGRHDVVAVLPSADSAGEGEERLVERLVITG